MSRTPPFLTKGGVALGRIALTVLLFAFGGGVFYAPDAHAQVSCGGLQSDACSCGEVNTYPCCSNDGNCTWYAWYCACCFWDEAIPHWGNAKQWAPGASTNPDYNVRSSPALDTIACRSVGTWGHVAWVTAISGSNVTVDEQNCDWGPGGVQEATRDVSYYDQGFIERAGCECSGNDTETEYDCNQHCGTRTQTCDGCNYGPWSDCVDGGPCVPGTEENEPCPSGCGEHTRMCDGDCQWGDWSECPDPVTCIDAAVEVDSAPPEDSDVVADANESHADGGDPPPPEGAFGFRGGCNCHAWGSRGTPTSSGGDALWLGMLLIGLLVRLNVKLKKKVNR